MCVHQLWGNSSVHTLSVFASCVNVDRDPSGTNGVYPA